jgi:hypothetical protein
VKVSSKQGAGAGAGAGQLLGKCWAWAMAVAADTTLQLGLERLDRAAEK